MDTLAQNYQEKWNALLDEYKAKADRLDAEQRMRYNDALEDIGSEGEAIKDWTEASYKELVAKANRTWQEYAIERQEESINS